MGGGTTKIGDPSFRKDERALLSQQIETNISTIKNAFTRYINFSSGNKALMLDNSDWLDKLNYIEMLLEIEANSQ